MGIDVTWRAEDRERHGDCAPFLKQIVRVTLHNGSGIELEGIPPSQERQREVVLNDPQVYPVKVDGQTYTPFCVFDGGESIDRLVLTRGPALEGFSFMQNLLERYVGIALEYNMPIELR